MTFASLQSASNVSKFVEVYDGRTLRGDKLCFGVWSRRIGTAVCSYIAPCADTTT